MGDLEVRVTDDPAHLWEEAGSFLRLDPVAHNGVVAALRDAEQGIWSGRWWTVLAGTEVLGVAGQAPPTAPVQLTPMSRAAVESVVSVVAASPDREIPGVMAEAATAAVFAGCWSECTRGRVRVRAGQRLYRLDEPRPVGRVPGRLRQAGTADRARLVPWLTSFAAETDAPVSIDPDELFTRLVAKRSLYVWENGTSVSMARATPAAVGVSRIGYVYTPAALRGQGYALACVGELSRYVHDDLGTQCMLYTELENPTSNRIYRRLGYRAVSEMLVYDFVDA